MKIDKKIGEIKITNEFANKRMKKMSYIFNKTQKHSTVVSLMILQSRHGTGFSKLRARLWLALFARKEKTNG